MKKHIYHSLTLFSLFLLFIGCTEKEAAQPEPILTQKKVIMQPEGASYKNIYYYDSNNILQKMKSISTSTNDSTIYTVIYQPLVITKLYHTGATTTYELDGNGKVKRYGSYSFAYDTNGYRTSTINENEEYYYKYSGGNLIEEIEINKENQPFDTIITTFEYDLIHKDEFRILSDLKVHNGMFAIQLINPYFGHSNKNLLKKMIKKKIAGDSETTLDYTFDAKNMPIKVVISRNYGTQQNTPTVVHYLYE